MREPKHSCQLRVHLEEGQSGWRALRRCRNKIHGRVNSLHRELALYYFLGDTPTTNVTSHRRRQSTEGSVTQDYTNTLSLVQK